VVAEMTGRKLNNLLKRRLRRALAFWQQNVDKAQSKDEGLYYLSGVLQCTGEIRHLVGKLSPTKSGLFHGTSMKEIDDSVRALYEGNPTYFVNRLMREFEDSFRVFDETIRNELAPENFEGGEIPLADRSEFEYYALFMRDAFEYISGELERLGLPLAEEIKRRVDELSPALRLAIEKGMQVFAVKDYLYSARPEIFPQEFWWRELAWTTYAQTRT